MKRVRFLGDGLPPRPGQCRTCGRQLAIDCSAFINDKQWSPAFYCSLICYRRDYPDDPEANVAQVVEEPATPPAGAHPADDGETW